MNFILRLWGVIGAFVSIASLSVSHGALRPEESINAMNLLDGEAILEVGDNIEYYVTEDREDPAILFVDEKGHVNIPLLGRFQAQGLTPRDLAFQIKAALEVDFYHQATVNVSLYLDSSSRGQVFILGRVVRQGPLDIPSGEVLTVSKAILRAGGFEQAADPANVTLVRKDNQGSDREVRFTVNVAEILDTGDLEKDLTVQANDMIFVGQRGAESAQYTISGAVRAPGVKEMTVGGNLTLSQAVLQAGGFSDFANQAKVKVIRVDENGERTEKVVNVADVLDKGQLDKDLRIERNDMIIVPEKWINF